MLEKNFIRQPFWAIGTEEVFRILESQKDGLAIREVDIRRGTFGANTIIEGASHDKFKIFLNQFKSPLLFILIFAGVTTAFLGEWVETMVIFAAVILNASLGFYQENRAETALETLRSYIRARVRVRRSDGDHEIDASELVPGDLVRIRQGDRVPADMRLIFTNNLEVDEAVLTGESAAVFKNPRTLSASASLVDRTCMLFSGTLVSGGFGDAIVTAIGNDTEFGKIAKMVAGHEREATPLQRAMFRFTMRASILLGFLVLVLFLLGVKDGYGVFEMFLIGVAVAVSAVPEGLPVALTVILAVGVERLAKNKGIVRRLLAAETLGSTSLILTDKTGTLTEARMEVSGLFLGQAENKIKERELFEAALSNTDVVIENSSDSYEKWEIFGRPIESALVKNSAKIGIPVVEFLQHLETIDKIPFSSGQKFSASVLKTLPEGYQINLLGAPEILLESSSLSDEDKKKYLNVLEAHATRGERVLGVAQKIVAKKYQGFVPADRLLDFEFLGFIFFRDPLRKGVPEAIRRINRAGVKTIILTGDHHYTAEAVARELGMIDGKGAMLTGKDLLQLGKAELLNRADAVTVYARVTPEQKMQLVEMYKEKGEVVAVTGDGVNDAPALKAADIGVAVGFGTDIAKGAADLVLLNNNFETLVLAIEEGRRILDNIRKVIVYLLSNALDELLLIGGSILLGIQLPLTALQILFVNFFSDSFPAIGFAFERGVDDLGEKPRKLDQNLFDHEMRFLIVIMGAATSFLLFIIYLGLLNWGFPQDLASSFVFATFSTYSLMVVFSLRSLETSIWRYNPFANKYLTVGVVIGFFLTACAIYIPFLQKILGTVPLPPLWIAGVMAVGILNIGAVEFGKWLFRSNILKL